MVRRCQFQGMSLWRESHLCCVGMLTEARWAEQNRLEFLWPHVDVKVHLPKCPQHQTEAPPWLWRLCATRGLTSSQTAVLRIRGWTSFSSFESSDLSVQVHGHPYSERLGRRRRRCDTRAVRRNTRTLNAIRSADLEKEANVCAVKWEWLRWIALFFLQFFLNSIRSSVSVNQVRGEDGGPNGLQTTK